MASVPADRAGGAGPKGEAIASAALRLFLRDGYERTSVDAIAAEAGVSKRTIYNRYGEQGDPVPLGAAGHLRRR